MRGFRQLGWCLGLLVVAAALAFAVARGTHQVASAATCTDSWVGASGAWEDGSQWSTHAPPTTSDDACLPALTAGAYTVTVTSSPSIHSLTVGSASGNAVAVTIEGVGCASNAAMTVTANVTVRASGQLAVTAVGNGNCQQSAGASWSGTLTNAGTITTSAGNPNGFRYLRGTLSSSGTINVTTNTSYDAAGSTLTNTGTVNVATGATLTLTSATFTNNGTIVTAGSGALAMTSGTFNQGSKTAGSNAVSLASSSTLNLTGAGPGSFAFTSDGSLTGNVAAGQQVTIEGQGCASNASVSAAAAFSNAGAITITTVGNGGCPQSAGLSWPGTLTNTGTITTSAGSTSGPRNLTGTLLNSGGTFAVGGSTFYSSSSGTLTNSGAVTVSTGAAFTITSTTVANNGSLTMGDASTMALSGGTFTNTGGISSTGSAAVSLSGATFNQGANSAGINPVTLAASSTLNLTGAGSGSFAFTADGTLTGDIAADQQVAIDGNGCAADANVAATAAFSNAGSITLSVINNGGCSQNAGLTWPGTLTNSGTITSNTGVSGGLRYLRGTLTTSGTVSINTNTSYDTAGATLTNTGAVNVASGATLTLTSATFTNNGSIVSAGSGGVTLVASTFNQGASSAGINPVALSGSSTLNLTGAGAGTFAFIADGNLSGNIAAGQQVGLDAIGCLSNANVTAAAAFTNAGSITLTTINNGGCAQTAGLSWPGTLTNSGTITSSAGVAGGSRYLRGNLSSTGTLTISTNTAFDSAGTTLTNKGTVSIGTGATLTASSTTFTNNGTVVTTGTGNVVVSGGTFNQGAHSAGTNPVTLSASSSLDLVGAGAGIFAFTFDGTITGNIAAGQQVMVEGLGCASNANVSATAAFTSAGSITLTTVNNGNCPQTVGLSWPGTLTNSGTITSSLGVSGGPRYLRGSVTNSGTVTIGTNTSFDTAGASLTSASAGRLAITAGATLTMTGSQALTQQPGSTFEDGIDAAAGQGRVVGAATAALAGTLRIDTTGEPATGTVYPLISAGSVSGTFGGLAFAGEGYVIQYSATSVAALVDPEPTISSLSPNKGVQGAVGRVITVNGTNFMPGVQEAFSGTGITITSSSFVSSSKLTVTVTISSSAPLGGQTLTVTNPDGGAAGARFTVDPQPVVTSASPSALGQGATAQTVLLTGTGFVTGDAARFSGTGVTIASTTVVSPTQLSVVVSVAATATPGTRTITVTNKDGGLGTCSGCFTVDAGPTVTSANPPSMARGASNQDVVLGGTNFVSGATVSFSGSGITVNSVTWNSAAQLTVNITVASAAATGAVTVTVINPDQGQGSCATCFSIT